MNEATLIHITKLETTKKKKKRTDNSRTDSYQNRTRFESTPPNIFILSLNHVSLSWV